MSALIKVPISPGELIDKITILQIKSERIRQPEKLANIQTELDALQEVATRHVTHSETLQTLSAQLKQVNEELWDIEDDIRDCERNKDFGETFIALARAVYHTNDKRAALKSEINTLLGSTLAEEKSYTDY